MKTIMAKNEKTGLHAVVDSERVNIYKKLEKPVFGSEWSAVRIGCKVGDEKRKMYKYGKSKTIHWSRNCAKPNTEAVPVEVELLEAILSGHKECRNCWFRTRAIDPGGPRPPGKAANQKNEGVSC